jgi:signal transduction histidine kinase
MLPDEESLRSLLDHGPVTRLHAIYSDRTFEVRERLLMGDRDFGSIRIGLSMLLVRDEIEQALQPAALAALLALVVATFVSILLAQWVLRPIHVVSTGLTRLGRGEFGVKLDLPPGEEFADLGRSFDTVSAELSAVRSRLAGQPAHFESIVERLEDAVAVIGPGGEILFANPAMRGMLGFEPASRVAGQRIPVDHPYQRILDPALSTRTSRGPTPVKVVPGADQEVEHLVTASVIGDAEGGFVGVMLVARNLGYLSQVQSTLLYSRKLAALGRLLAGVAHEVKNPLNAMAIHLELLKQKLQGGGRRRAAGGATEGARDTSALDVSPVLHHANVIGQEIRRLDDVVQGFLKFSRPEELALQPVAVRTLIEDVACVVEPEAAHARVVVRNDCPDDLPPVNGDPAMLRQAFLNLALNACQAMPNGGTLRFGARTQAGGMVEFSVEDTGAGIDPEHLGKIFDLYYTTRQGGSGIGLSMVYRTVQLHDGSIEVESTPGVGTTFRVRLPQAQVEEPMNAAAPAARAGR